MGRHTSEATERLLDELRRLALPAGQYAIFGSGPMGVRGLREIHDVDVIAAPALFAKLAESHPAEDHKHGLHKIQIGNVEILDGWYPDVGPIEALIAEADLIDGLPFVKLEKVLAWKEKYGRTKDGADIELIRRHLAAAAPPTPARALTMEQYLPILGHELNRAAGGTLYVSAGEGDITASWLRRLHDGTSDPRLDRVVLLRLRDDIIQAMEGRRELERGFGERLHQNLATLRDLLERRCVTFEIREVERLPPFHGYLYGDHFFRGRWMVGETGHFHVRTTVEYLTRSDAPRAFAEAMAVFEAAPIAAQLGNSPRGAGERTLLSVGVIVPLHEEWEVLAQVFPVTKSWSEDGIFYYELDAGLPGVRVVGTYVEEMGPLTAATRAAHLIDHFKPAMIALAGIAGSLDGDVKLGDVVAATEVNQFNATSKAVKDGERFRFKYSGTHYRLDFALSQAIKNFSQTRALHEDWQRQGVKARADLGLPADSPFASPAPRGHAGHLASGDTVGAAEAYAVELLGIDRKFLALEMEAAGVAHAAFDRARPVKWLAVRGISDFSDERKQDLDGTRSGAWRRYAMHNAATYLRALLGWDELRARISG